MVLAMASVLPCLFFLLSFMLPICVVAQSNGNFGVGSTLSATTNASSSWLSASGDFAFGFYKLGSEDMFLLSIWYAKIPDKTIVWYANDGTPVPIGSTAALTSGDGLVLSGPKGEEIWKSNPNIFLVASATMNNTGNFVLKSDDSQVLWESFKNPTDTILPTQIMERGSVVSSRLTETNFSTGRFQLRLLQDGNLVLNSINLPTTYANEAYYISDTYDESNSTNSGYQVVFYESGYMFILRANNKKYDLTSGEVGSEAEFYYRATLSWYGVFTQYRHPKNSSGNWSAIWSEPDNICGNTLVNSGSGVCGYNSVCRLDLDRRPICDCPPGYSLLDPNDAYGSCKQDLELSCAEEARLNTSAEDLYTIEEITDTDWPLSDYVLLKPYTADQCRESCLHDCMCAVAIFGLSENCWKKRLPLSNGRVDNSNGRKAFIKIRKDNGTSGLDPHLPFPDMKRKKENQDNLILAGSVLLGGSMFLNFILVATGCYRFFIFYPKKHRKTNQAGGSSVETSLRCFSYKELVEATNGFKEELGRGAFGIVYKGQLQTGPNHDLVAVKRLDKVLQDGEKEFKTEVNVIGRTHQKNLVRLIGFCDEGQHRLLVYEYLRNGTLANFLFGDLKPSWSQRTDLAFGIAKGLLYLHEECNTQIIHCDIKPQNMLLDDYYNARISDFGLAKLLMLDQSHTNTGIRGTKGYVAPEWFRNMPITVKVDVYSFGVLLLEVITCRRSVEMDAITEDRAILTDWAYDCYRQGTLDALVNDDLEALNDMVKLERFVMIALWCIQEDPSLRPTMRKVSQMLEGVVEVSVPPCPCPFSVTTSI